MAVSRQESRPDSTPKRDSAGPEGDQEAYNGPDGTFGSRDAGLWRRIWPYTACFGGADRSGDELRWLHLATVERAAARHATSSTLLPTVQSPEDVISGCGSRRACTAPAWPDFSSGPVSGSHGWAFRSPSRASPIPTRPDCPLKCPKGLSYFQPCAASHFLRQCKAPSWRRRVLGASAAHGSASWFDARRPSVAASASWITRDPCLSSLLALTPDPPKNRIERLTAPFARIAPSAKIGESVRVSSVQTRLNPKTGRQRRVRLPLPRLCGAKN